MCADLVLNNDCNQAKSIFKPYLFNGKEYSDECHAAFRIRPRWDWLTMNYGIERIRMSSNIIFT